MQAVHELGHILGAVLTGGTVNHVSLHPLAISRTDVNPNPVPEVVVWAGPLVGCCLPTLIAFGSHGFLSNTITRRTRNTTRQVRSFLLFFTGFCLVANGAYLAIGTFYSVGDTRGMLRTGVPAWVLCALGTAAMSAGVCIWHQLGSVCGWFHSQDRSGSEAAVISSVVLLVVALELWLCG
ncbi:MAG: hypothetical protein MK102_13555 [Fuerstiella sp.]|nr:hypothetical protein [Fuerstiella sp.]